MAKRAPPRPGATADDAERRDRTGSQAQAVRLARKTQSLDILYEIATCLSQPGSLEQVLDGFLDAFIELVDARAASVRLASGEGHTRLIASRGLAPDVVERDRLMPVNKGFAIEELLAACRRFPLPFRQRMTFEYVLLADVNDARQDALRLARLLKGIRAKINLIPFNDWEGSSFARPPLARILDFQTVLLEHGIRATVRWSKGEDIGAACGQLREATVAV